MQICKQCRDYFHVWPNRLDERYALNTKDPAIRAQWAMGGDNNFDRRTKPSGLNMKRQAAELRQPNETDSDDSLNEPNEQPAASSGNLARQSSQQPASPPEIPSPPLHDPPSPCQSDVSYSIQGQEGLEDSLEEMLAPDEFVPDDDDQNEDSVESVPETESVGGLVEIDDSFFRGKTLILPVMSGEMDLQLCCLCHMPVDQGEALTTHLEFKLRLNSILSKNPNSFGIVFDYQNGDANYQMVCDGCLTSRSDSENGQSVRESVFTIEFHQKTGVLNSSYPTNVVELFNTKSTEINEEMISYLRDRFTEQERLLRYLVFRLLRLYFKTYFSTEVEFYKKRLDRKFLFTDQQQRNATGLTTEEFDELGDHIDQFHGYFVKVSPREALNLLLVYIR